jgi:hypothetical protein
VTAQPHEPPPQPRRLRLSAPLRWLLAIAVAAALFAVGVAVGEALHDNPKPGLTTTSVTTVAP